jgi:hypothetical protein
VGSWWSVEVGDREVPIWGKNYVPDTLMLAFADEDLVVHAPSIEALARYESDAPAVDSRLDGEHGVRQSRLFHYTATAGTIRTRLALQGFSTKWVCKLATAFVEDRYDGDDPFEYWPEGAPVYPNAGSVISALTSRRGLSRISARYSSTPGSETGFLHGWWEELHEAFDDPRFALALTLARTRATTPVTVDLSDLVLGGWLEGTELPHQAARSRLSTAISADGPVIVIVEGSSDARWLERALELAVPEVSHCFEFLDFHQHNPPGGVDRVVSLTKGMAAAGVMNRVVAVFDNDTAGQDAARHLAGSSLPERFSVVTLPDVSFAGTYPTLGPEGQHNGNVNGRAVSIEFMFGDQVLRDEDGSLFAVRWQSFIERASDYQGRLAAAHKKVVANRIGRALAEQDRQLISEEVLQGCRRLSKMLINAAHPPERVPASDASVLSSAWARDPFVELQIGG